ncbi:MAG: HAMP domain-containing sensor histidine kinase, partial [Bacteroidota bacterium]|nr:HAMP domain-containing sensor histidine kinase [Bacteroidota bacterium]
ELKNTYISELQIISDTALKLSKSPSINDMCKIIGNKIYELFPKSIIVLTLYNETDKLIRVKELFANSKSIKIANSIIKNDIYKFRWDSSKFDTESIELFNSAKVKIAKNGLFSLTLKKIPRKICSLIEKNLNITSTYFIGFFLNNKLYGGISILLTKNTKLKYINTIETLANHFSIEMRRRIAEQNIQEINSLLSHRVNEEVQKSREKDRLMLVQSRQAAIGETIGNIAHQWRQPLNTIGLLIQDLEDANYHNELNSEYLKNTVTKTNTQLNYLSQTINDFRNFFKPQEKPVVFNIKKSIQNAIDIIRDSLISKRIEINLNSKKSYNTLGYPNEFSQAILNIINNSKDAFIENKIKNAIIAISIKEEKNIININISDNAGGIEEKNIDKIFDPYFSTKGKSQGTGLGLHMTKTIIERNMSGKIEVKNINKGLMFTIFIQKTK